MSESLNYISVVGSSKIHLEIHYISDANLNLTYVRLTSIFFYQKYIPSGYGKIEADLELLLVSRQLP
jgi:hypothetical protein